PACRHPRGPTVGDTPISRAASSERAPCAIAAQNWTRSCRQATVGRPGEGICPRYNCTARCRSRIVAINTSTTEVLRRPVESAQYTSLAFGRRLTDTGLVASMGTIGDAPANAAAESFFAPLECELLDRHDWPTRQALRTAVFDFIEVFYNRQRRHSTLDYASPATYERQHTSPAPAASQPCPRNRGNSRQALRSRPSGGGSKPPHAALAEDRRGERCGKGTSEVSGGDKEIEGHKTRADVMCF